jgi:hypothetical protein
MSDEIGLLIFSIGLLSSVYFSYIVWVKPKKYMDHLHERRMRLKSKLPWVPDWFIGYIFFYEQPRVSIWWARFGLLIAVFINIVGLVGVLWSPF